MLIGFCWETGPGLEILFSGYEVLFSFSGQLPYEKLGRAVLVLNGEICLLQQL